VVVVLAVVVVVVGVDVDEVGVVVVVAVVAAVVVVVDAVVALSTISSTLFAEGAAGVTPFGSKARVTRRSTANLIFAGLVVRVGVFWASVDQ
jgi:hypothetical protein